jgi:hypothetical protein
MFMIVTYPWPVPTAHVELTGPPRRKRQAGATESGRDSIGTGSAGQYDATPSARSDESGRVGQLV